MYVGEETDETTAASTTQPGSDPTTAASTTQPATTVSSNTSLCPSYPCPSCSTSTVLASAISVIATALLATVVFVLVQIAVCRYHLMLRAELAVPAEGTQEAVYEQVDAMNNPTYIYSEIGERGKVLELKQNEAYGTAIAVKWKLT